MHKLLLHFTYTIVILLFFSSCNYYHEGEDAWINSDSLSVDSVDFRKNHHYWCGYNFVATDTFHILSRPPFSPRLTYTKDSVILIENSNAIVVEDIKKDTISDSSKIWIRIAAINISSATNTYDKTKNITPSIGWIEENKLIGHVVPDTPISKIIHALGSQSFKIFLFIIGVLAGCFWFFARKKMDNVSVRNEYYPTLFFVLSGSVVMHRSIWHFVPETWVEFYFTPSLNPFDKGIPFVISAFLFMFWLLIIIVLAVSDDIRQKTNSFRFLLSLIGRIIIEVLFIFAFFAVICPFWLLYPTIIAYAIYLYVQHKKKRTTHYYCGKCGQPLDRLGICPNCGAENK